MVRTLVHRTRPDPALESQIVTVTGSVTNIESLQSVFEGAEIVCHLVGLIAETRAQTFEEIVARGTANVVEACRQAGVRRLLYISAIGTSNDAASKYHRTKYAAEQAVISSGLEYVILRPSVIYGPGDGFITMLDRLIRMSPVTPVIGSGRYKLQPVFIDDLVDVMVRSMTSDVGLERIIEIGGPEKLEFLEILNIIKQVTGRRRLNLYLPPAFMKLIARLMETVMKPAPITTDQLLMMEAGNVVQSSETIELFGVQPVALKDGLREYMRT
jgi:NADH dehydrogenase